ncbi:hypothetical protein RCC89_06350 [Cytophagaceae bacterium ABcell3]|nr:hypothetical protein RCC89_06350 [Cytophagaceae bacterium ABcell3]
MNNWLLLIFLLLSPAACLLAQEETYAPYGGPFTPAGDLHMLVVLAGFENDCAPDRPEYNHNFWPQEDGQNPACQSAFDGIEELFYSTSDQFSPDAKDLSISNFFYQSSRNSPSSKPFRVTADIFPERINIDGNRPNNKKVFEAIEEKYPDFDWSRYDNRTNNPQFTFDNSTSDPDNIIDYIVVIWRRPGLSGYASTSNYTFNQDSKDTSNIYKVASKSGFTIDGSLFNLTGIKQIFLHELSHSLYNCPHLFGVNGVCGSYFHATNGWGMMKFGEITSTPNAWESWYNGWIDLPKNRDLKDISDNGTYILDDFMNTGDAMRIKIPYTDDQYLWLENHTGENIFDQRTNLLQDANENHIPKMEHGLLMYVENLTDSRNTLIKALSSDYANGIKAMHAEGNYDYKIHDYKKAPEIWDNMVADFSIAAPNPTGAHNHITFIRHDFGLDSNESKIVYRDFTNNRCQNSDCKSNEHTPVWKRDGVFTFDNLGINMAFGNKSYEQKIGLSHNPHIVNLQRYDKASQTSEPVILHSLSVNVHPKLPDGRIKVDIKFDDNTITQNQRFTGNLLLPEKGNLNASLHIQPRKKLRIEKSGTPDRHTKGKVLENGSTEFPDFTNPSILTLSEGSHLIIDNKAKLIIKKGSTLNIEKGATLEIKEKGKLIVENGAYINIQQGANINANNIQQLRLGTYATAGINPLLKHNTEAGLSIKEIKKVFY